MSRSHHNQDSKESKQSKQNEMFEAIQLGDLDRVKTLAKDKKNFTADEKEITPLMQAVLYGKKEIVTYFVDNFDSELLSIDAKQGKGFTAADLALKQNQADILESLLKKGASFPRNLLLIDSKDCNAIINCLFKWATDKEALIEELCDDHKGVRNSTIISCFSSEDDPRFLNPIFRLAVADRDDNTLIQLLELGVNANTPIVDGPLKRHPLEYILQQYQEEVWYRPDDSRGQKQRLVVAVLLLAYGAEVTPASSRLIVAYKNQVTAALLESVSLDLLAKKKLQKLICTIVTKKEDQVSAPFWVKRKLIGAPSITAGNLLLLHTYAERHHLLSTATTQPLSNPVSATEEKVLVPSPYGKVTITTPSAPLRLPHKEKSDEAESPDQEEGVVGGVEVSNNHRIQIVPGSPRKEEAPTPPTLEQKPATQVFLPPRAEEHKQAFSEQVVRVADGPQQVQPAKSVVPVSSSMAPIAFFSNQPQGASKVAPNKSQDDLKAVKNNKATKHKNKKTEQTVNPLLICPHQ